MYRITIEQIQIKEMPLSKEWEPQHEIDGKKQWGYTPETTTKKQVTCQIYQQSVEEIDLTAVILAVNRINNPK